SAFMIADRQNDLPRTQRRCICGRRNRQSVRLEPKHGDVSGWVSTRERGLDLASARKRDLEVFVLLDRLLGGHDDAGTPMNTACGPSATAMNSDDAGGSAFDKLYGVIRKRDQWAGGLGHGKVSKRL